VIRGIYNMQNSKDLFPGERGNVVMGLGVIELWNIWSCKGARRITQSNSLLLAGLPKTKPYDQERCPDAP